MPTLTILVEHSIGSHSQINQRRKRYKRNQIGREEVKLSLFADDRILHIENPKDATRKLLKFINKLGKVAGHKVNIQKPAAFLYTNNIG